MLINSIFSENYLDEMKKADLILKLQLFINTDTPYDPQKEPPRKFKSSKVKDDEEEDPRSRIISNILDHCLDICEPVTMFRSSMVYKGIYDKSAFKVAAAISVYNTVCELIYSKHKAIGYTDISELLDKIHMTIDGMYKKNHSFKLGKSGYIHRSINEHINPETESRKKISYFAYNTSILLMDRYSEFKLDKWKNSINKCSRWDKLEKNILNYDYLTDKVISNLDIFENNEVFENFKENKTANLINKYSMYINNIYAFETIINKYLYEDILKFALYLLYYDYDLNDHLINTLVKFIDMPSVYSRNQLLFFFLLKLKGNINDFEYFETLNSSNLGMRIEVNEYVTKDAIYSRWVNNLETARKLFTGTVIPVFENALFILLYKYFNDNNQSTDFNDNHRIFICTPQRFILINRPQLIHIISSKCKIKNIYVFFHSFLTCSFRNNHDPSLHGIAKCYLCCSLAVFFRNLLYNRITYNISNAVLCKWTPRFVLNIVFFHPLVQIMLLPKKMCFHLVYSRNNLIECSNICHTLSRKIRNTDCTDLALCI